MSKFTRKLLTFRQGGSNNSTKTTKQIREMLGILISVSCWESRVVKQSNTEHFAKL